MIATETFEDRNDVYRTPEEYKVISVGKRYPGMLPSFGSQICLGDWLMVLIRLEGLSDKEVECFRRIEGYGFYSEPDFPHGLLIWRFASGLLFETPFNPRLEETLRPDQVRAFLDGRKNTCQRVLLDEEGTVRALGVLGMDWGLVDILKTTWGDPSLDWADYDERCKALAARMTIQEVWDKARKWRVKMSLPGGDADGSTGKAPVPEPCGACEASRAAVARLRGALKESKHREADQRQRMTDLQSQAMTLANDRAGLQARIASLSAGPLQQQVEALKATIDERDFRILEAEEEIQSRDKRAKLLAGKIDDLARRIKWLEGRLRENGLPVS